MKKLFLMIASLAGLSSVVMAEDNMNAGISQQATPNASQETVVDQSGNLKIIQKPAMPQQKLPPKSAMNPNAPMSADAPNAATPDQAQPAAPNGSDMQPPSEPSAPTPDQASPNNNMAPSAGDESTIAPPVNDRN